MVFKCRTDSSLLYLDRTQSKKKERERVKDRVPADILVSPY